MTKDNHYKPSRPIPDTGRTIVTNDSDDLATNRKQNINEGYGSGDRVQSITQSLMTPPQTTNGE